MIDEWVEPAPSTGSDNKMRFWERYPPHEGGVEYGPITGGFLVFDAYVIPDSLSEYQSSEYNDRSSGNSREPPENTGDSPDRTEPESDTPPGSKMAVSVKTRYRYGGPKNGTDAISSPTWTVNFQTPAEECSYEELLSGADIVSTSDITDISTVPEDAYPSLNEGPKPVIRDRTTNKDSLADYCSTTSNQPSYEREEQLLFDATDTAVHRKSDEPSVIEWTLWRSVNCSSSEQEAKFTCDSSPEYDCVRDYSYGWEELPGERQTGWIYSNSLSDPGRYKIELTTGDNTTQYEFRIGHTPMPQILHPSSYLNKQLVGQEVELDGTVSY